VGSETEARTLRCGSAIDAVTVLEDRAVVRRVALVSLHPGRNRIRLEEVSPVLVDKTVLASLSSREGGARVTDSRVERTVVHAAALATEEHRALDEDIRLLEASIATSKSRAAVAAAEAQSLARLLGMLVDEMAEDASWGRTVSADAEEGISKIVAKSSRVREEAAELRREIEEAAAALERKRARRAALDTPRSKCVGAIEVDVECGEDLDVELTVSYVVANACWRPRHRAVLGEDGAVTLATEGVVWQSTGEDWTEIACELSTDRPSLGADPPPLHEDRLKPVRKGALVVETRAEEIEQAGLGAGASPKKASEDLPGIDDGGNALHLKPAHRVTIASDGRPHAMALGQFESKGLVETVLFPELSTAAVVRATFTNAGSMPILAGPVELVRNGGTTGRTTTPFIAPGEKMALAFGNDGAIRSHREIEPLPDETSLIGSWTTKTHDVRVRIANLGPYAKKVLVRERVPVSEIEKVQVSTVARETTGERTPDEHGFVTWNVELPPLGRAKLSLRVAMRRHADVMGG